VATAQLWQIVESFPPQATNLCLHWENNETDPGLSLGLWSLLQEPGVLYVSGTVRRPNIGQSALGVFNQPKMNNAFPPRQAQEPAIPFVLRISTGSVLSLTQVTCFYPTGGMMQGYGRALLVKGDTLYFLIGLRRDVATFSTLAAGWSEAALPFASLSLSGLSGLSARVLFLGLKKGNLEPITTPLLGDLKVEPLWAYDGFTIPSPSMLYPVRVGDTLWLTWSDSRPTEINGDSYGSPQRVYLMAWTGMESFLPTPINGAGNGVLWQSSAYSYAPGLVYHQGRVFLPLVKSSGGSTLGRLQRAGGTFSVDAPVDVLLGNPAPRWYGLAADSYGHLYGFGTGQGVNFRYHTLQGSGMESPIISLSPVYSSPLSGRGWVGRLLWYRWAGPTGTLSRCNPDTAGGPFAFTLYGRWEAGESIFLEWRDSSYRARSAGHLSVPADRADTLQVAIPSLYLPGRSAGPEFLSVWTGWPRSLLCESLSPALSFQGSGSSYTDLHRQDTAEVYWVLPFVGEAQASVGWRQASQGGPFPRRAARIDGEAGPSPHYAFAYVPFDPSLASEALYIAVNYSDSVFLYRMSFATGQVERYLSWRRSSGSGAPPGEIADHIEQLTYDPAWGRLLAVEGYHRIRAIPLVTPPNPRPRLVPLSIWEITADRAHPLQVQTDTLGRLWIGGLWRATPTDTLPTLAVENLLLFPPIAVNWVGEPLSAGCPSLVDGDVWSARIASVRALAVPSRGPAQAYVVDWGHRPDCSAPPRLYLRQVTSSGEVVTIDSFWTGGFFAALDSVRIAMEWQAHPTPHLLLTLADYATGAGYLLRYWLDGRPNPRDTLVGPGDGSSGCGYGQGRSALLSWPKAVSLAQTRGGFLLYSVGGEIRAALPLYVQRSGFPDTTRWDLAQALSGSVSSSRAVDLQSGGTRLRWFVDSLRLGYDSLWITAPICGSSAAAARFLAASYTLPSYSTSIQAPSIVCQGQLFHALVGYGGNEFFYFASSQVGRPEACALQRLFRGLTFAVEPPNKAQLLHTRVQEGEALGRLPAFARFVVVDSCQSCQVRFFISSRSREDSILSRAFLGGESWGANVSFRRGHQLGVRVLLEGPATRRGSLQRLGSHPLFTRAYLLESYENGAGPLGDTLWLLPLMGDGTGALWDRIGGQAYPADTSAAPSRWSTPTWVSPCRVEVRESPDGPAVDRAWGLVDTAGWVWAFAPPLVDSSDAPTHPLRSHYQPWRLSFCRCDTASAKWVVVRFPHHLLLRSAGPLSLSNGLLSNDPAAPTFLDLTDPTYLDGIPGEHYTLTPDPFSPGASRAAAWAGNCDDRFHSAAYPGQTPPDASRINAADYEFMRLRNGITGPAFTPADLDADGYVNAADLLLLIPNMNALRQGITE